MKKVYWRGLYISIILGLYLTSNAQFTAGRLVVLQAGDGNVALSNASVPVFLKEFTTTVMAGVSVIIPVTGTNRLTISGSAGSDGQMTLSQDRKIISIAGFDVASATTAGAVQTTTANTRVINIFNGNLYYSTGSEPFERRQQRQQLSQHRVQT